MATTQYTKQTEKRMVKGLFVQSITVNSHMQGACSDLSSTFSDPLNTFSPPKSHPNFNSDHCRHINAGMLSILYFNARSLVLKFDELGLMLVETHQPDIV